jgi:hypothetical protein
MKKRVQNEKRELEAINQHSKTGIDLQRGDQFGLEHDHKEICAVGVLLGISNLASR